MRRECPGGWTERTRHPPRYLGEAPGPTDQTTHGMCDECKRAVDEDLAEEERRLTDVKR